MSLCRRLASVAVGVMILFSVKDHPTHPSVLSRPRRVLAILLAVTMPWSALGAMQGCVAPVHKAHARGARAHLTATSHRVRETPPVTAVDFRIEWASTESTPVTLPCGAHARPEPADAQQHSGTSAQAPDAAQIDAPCCMSEAPVSTRNADARSTGCELVAACAPPMLTAASAVLVVAMPTLAVRTRIARPAREQLPPPDAPPPRA